MKDIDFEWPTDAVAGEVLESSVDRELIDACLPRLLGGEAPVGFFFRRGDRAF